MKLPPSFIGLAPKVATFFREATTIYSAMRESEEAPSPEMVAMVLQVKMADWNPTIRGFEILDDETKAAGARFLAGIACRIGSTTSSEAEAAS